jgi:predicted dehydrogenase
MYDFDDPENAPVVSVSDLDPEKLTLVRRRHAGVEVTTEFRELSADPRVDAVAIVTAVTYYQAALVALASMCWSTNRSSGLLYNPVT